MKKLLTIVCALFCTVMLFACGTPQESIQESDDIKEVPSIRVNVTIVDSGEFVVSRETVYVTDVNSNEKFDIDDVLTVVHDKKEKADDYKSETTEWGLSIKKLWGDESGAFGYYVNDASAWSLTDEVKEGDFLTAFVYKDKAGYSDSYSYFNVRSAEVVKGNTVTLSLNNLGYNESWETVTFKTAGATITVNGADTEYVTDENGNVTLTFTEAGEYVISAKGADISLVPAVCALTVK